MYEIRALISFEGHNLTASDGMREKRIRREVLRNMLKTLMVLLYYGLPWGKSLFIGQVGGDVCVCRYEKIFFVAGENLIWEFIIDMISTTSSGEKRWFARD
jgi:hypothetical protein